MPDLYYYGIAAVVIIGFSTAVESVMEGPKQKSPTNYDAQLAKFDKLRINGDNYDSIRGLHLRLYNTAVKAVIGHMGKRLYKELDDNEERRLLALCLDRVEDKNDLILPAKCLTIARERFNKKKANISEVILPNNNATAITDNARKTGPKISPFAKQSVNKSKSKKWSSIGKKRAKKDRPIKLEDKILKLKVGRHNVINDVPSFISLKGKKPFRPVWPTGQEGGLKPRRFKRSHPPSPRAKPLPVKNLERLERLKDNVENKSPITRVTELIRGFFSSKTHEHPANSTFLASTANPTTSETNWQRTYDGLKKIKEELDAKTRRFPGVVVAERRMYDIVLDREETSLTPSERASPAALVNDVVELFSSWSNGEVPLLKKKSGASKRTLSPRIMPIVASDGEGRGMLSPSLFALYDDVDKAEGNEVRRKPDSIAPMPKILNAVGVSDDDRETIISTLIDVSGTTEMVDNALTVLRELNFLEPEVNGPIFDAREKMVEAFNTFESAFHPHQKQEFDSHGMTFANRKQIERLLFNDQHVLNLTKNDVDLSHFDRFEHLNRRQRDEVIWATIKHIATNDTSLDSIGRRERRQTTKGTIKWLTVNEPTVLSPYAFSPTYGLTVIGPIVLSPNIFSPPILNPSVIAPSVLSPILGSPYILRYWFDIK